MEPVIVSEPIDLRGAESRVGTTSRYRHRAVLSDGRIRVTADGLTETDTVESVAESEYDAHVLAVDGGRVTQLRERVLVEKETRTLRIGGETQTDVRPSPLVGETIDYRRQTDGAWAVSLAGKAATPEQAEELKWYPTPNFYRDLLPARPVTAGTSWEVPLTELRRLFGPRTRLDSGRWKMTFTRLVVVNGERCAEIAEEVEVTGASTDPAEKSGGWVRLTGTTVWALGNGRTFTTQLHGPMEDTTETTENGVRVTTSTTGTLRIETSHDRR